MRGSRRISVTQASENLAETNSPAISSDYAEVGIEQLLERQLSAMKDALACNKAIVQQLKAQRVPRGGAQQFPEDIAQRASCEAAVSDAAALENVNSRQAVASASITTPLLSPNSSVDIPTPRTPKKKGRELAHSRSLMLETATAIEVKRVVGDADKDIEDPTDGFAADGLFPAIARHTYFSNLTIAAITLYTVWIGIETDLNKWDNLAEAPLAFQVVDNLFCFVFTFETVVRIMAARRVRDLLRSIEFLLDSALVALMVWDTWIEVGIYLIWGQGSGVDAKGYMLLRLLRLFRLCRILKAGRLVRAAPEIMILFKGMIAAMRSVVTIIFVLCLITYIIGIIFVDLLSQHAVAAGRFETVPMSMNFLMIQVICGIDAGVVMDLLHHGWACYLLFLVFVYLASLTTMNMLVGVVVNVVSAVGEGERSKLKAALLEDQIKLVTAKFDWDSHGSMEKKRFDEWLMRPSMLVVLRRAEIDITLFVDFLRSIIADHTEVSRDVFEECLRKFTNFRSSTVKDIVGAQQRHSLELANIEQNILKHIHDLHDLKEHDMCPQVTG